MKPRRSISVMMSVCRWGGDGNLGARAQRRIHAWHGTEEGLGSMARSARGGGRGLQEHWALRDDGIPQVRLSGLLGPSGRLICCPPETAKNPFVPPLMRCSLFFGFPIHPQKVDTWIPGVQMMPPMTGPSVLRRMAPSTISCTRLEHLAARIASASVDSSPHG